MDRGAWWAMVHGVAKSRTRLTTLLIPPNNSASSSQFFILNSVKTTVWFLSLDWTLTDTATLQ